jgi:large subunit ribosomal protein L24
MSNTKLKIRKGDVVQVLSGKDRGKQGRVLAALPREGKVVVENLNTIKRHLKPRPMKDPSRMGATQMIPGGVIDRPAPIQISNVMVVCPVCKRPTRIAHDVKEVKGERHRTRVCKRADCGQEIDR